jgi:hypothetical protein
MFGETYTIDTAGVARLTVRATEPGVDPRALVLEVLVTGGGPQTWLDVLACVEKRIEVLHGEIDLDGVRLSAGDRATLAAGGPVGLKAAVGSQLVCDLKPAGDPVALADALRRASAATSATPRRPWRAPAALALFAALLVGLAVGHEKPAVAHGASVWSGQMHLGG